MAAFDPVSIRFCNKECRRIVAIITPSGHIIHISIKSIFPTPDEPELTDMTALRFLLDCGFVAVKKINAIYRLRA
jgi:hypothetical protein